MNRVMLLEALKVRQTEDLKDLLMPAVPTKKNPEPGIRPVQIFQGKTPDKNSERPRTSSTPARSTIWD